MESLQISRTHPSTESSCSIGILKMSRLLSSIPSTKVPPHPLAMAANSSTKSLRLGSLTLEPASRIRFSSRSSLRRGGCVERIY